MLQTALPKKAPSVHVTIDVRTSCPEPKDFNLFYTHGGGPPDPHKPHSVEWSVVGLKPGERVDIELRRIPSLQGRNDHDAVLHSVFADVPAPRTPRWSWSIPFGGGPVVSGEAHLPTSAIGKFEVEYDVLFVPARGLPRLLDPGIVLDPDPCP